MATRLILPDYIVSCFIPSNACGRCGRSDRNFTLRFPQLSWRKTDIELVYPLRCPCGGTGCVRIKLPKLLFGYILANVALIDAAHRRCSKATMTISPQRRSDMLGKMFLDFDRLMDADAAATRHSPPPQTPSSPPPPDDEQASLDNSSGSNRDCTDHNNDDNADNNANDADDAERIKFGFDNNEWKAFLRRLGLVGPNTDDRQS